MMRPWITTGNPTGAVKIDDRHYLLKEGMLYRPSVKQAILRVLTLAIFIIMLAFLFFEIIR